MTFYIVLVASVCLVTPKVLPSLLAKAIALILSLDEPDPAFDEPRNYRAEARSRAEVRRQRQEDIEDLRQGSAFQW